MDFFLGEVTRDHGDVDRFTWARGAAALTGALTRPGTGRFPGHRPASGSTPPRTAWTAVSTMLDKDAEGRMVVAGGPWAGTRWPEGPLGEEPGRIGESGAPVFAPREIEIKRMMPVRDPSRPRRAKDAADVARPGAALRDRRALSSGSGRTRA
ncbi:aminoglycoside adenylyltransferase [Streptomyces sp. SAS_269]